MVTPHAPTPTDSIKYSNLRSILELLRRYPDTARSDLARMTGLQPSTVSNLVRELINGKWVLEGGRGPSGSGGGKPGTLLSLSPDRGGYLAFVWTARFFAAVLTDTAGRRRAGSRDYYTDTRDVVTLIREYTQRIASRLPANVPLLGIAAAVGSVVDGSGAVRSSADFPYAEDDLSGRIARTVADVMPERRDQFGLPVVENDANCIAVQAAYATSAGETTHKGRPHTGRPPQTASVTGTDNVLSLVFSLDPPTVGAGMVIGDRLWRGSHGSAGELLAADSRHSIADLDYAAAVALRFADPRRLVMSLPAGLAWRDLHRTVREVEAARIPVDLVDGQDAAIQGATLLAYQASLDQNTVRI